MTKEAETPFEKFREFTRKVVSIPKSEIDQREAEYQKARKKNRCTGEPDGQIRAMPHGDLHRRGKPVILRSGKRLCVNTSPHINTVRDTARDEFRFDDIQMDCSYSCCAGRL